MKAFDAEMLRLFFLRSLMCLLLAPAALLAQETGEIVVGTYNVRNYLAARPKREGEQYAPRVKPAKEVEALIKVIAEVKPDVLGLQEMGVEEKFAEFRQKLKEAGLDYPHYELVNGADPDRHVALVSKFPIVARNSVPKLSYELNGLSMEMKRGILDVTVKVNEKYELRLVGVHLKSKLPTPEGEAIMRRNEAVLLRKHLERIMTTAPKTNLMVFGDFNDTKNEPPILEIQGARNTPMYLFDLWARDQYGDRWTHYWSTADEYARFDYLMTNKALFLEVVKNKSQIYRSPIWNDASDHRLVHTSIIPTNKD